MGAGMDLCIHCASGVAHRSDVDTNLSLVACVPTERAQGVDFAALSAALAHRSSAGGLAAGRPTANGLRALAGAVLYFNATRPATALLASWARAMAFGENRHADDDKVLEALLTTDGQAAALAAPAAQRCRF